MVEKLHRHYCLYIPDCVAVTYPIKCKDIIKDLMYYKDLKHEIQSLTKCFYNPTLRQLMSQLCHSCVSVMSHLCHSCVVFVSEN